jgi:hypothetical protein
MARRVCPNKNTAGILKLGPHPANDPALLLLGPLSVQRHQLLQNLLIGQVDRPPTRRRHRMNNTNGPIYRLIFALKSEKGLEFWDKVTQKDRGGQLDFPF